MKTFKQFLTEMSYKTVENSFMVLYCLFKLKEYRYELEVDIEVAFLKHNNPVKVINDSKRAVYKYYKINTIKDIKETVLLDQDDWFYNILAKYFDPDLKGRREEISKFLEPKITNSKDLNNYKKIYLELASKFGEGSVEK